MKSLLEKSAFVIASFATMIIVNKVLVDKNDRLHELVQRLDEYNDYLIGVIENSDIELDDFDELAIRLILE